MIADNGGWERVTGNEKLERHTRDRDNKTDTINTENRHTDRQTDRDKQTEIDRQR